MIKDNLYLDQRLNFTYLIKIAKDIICRWNIIIMLGQNIKHLSPVKMPFCQQKNEAGYKYL